MNNHSYPALNLQPVTEATVKVCAERGHATHKVDGQDTGICPRCGEPADYWMPTDTGRLHGPRVTLVMEQPVPNDAANVHFPECSECGARPGQAHDPECTVDWPATAAMKVPCCACGGFDGVTAPERLVLGTFVTNVRQDPTQAYRLICGHSAI